MPVVLSGAAHLLDLIDDRADSGENQQFPKISKILLHARPPVGKSPARPHRRSVLIP